VTNYQALPDDETFLEPSGIRMGTQEMTRFGMTEKDFDVLSGYIADVVINNRSAKEEVKKFRQNFLKMHYCLPQKVAVPIAAHIVESIFPYSDFGAMFAENLTKNL
jgi:hypothetical protein